MRNKPPGKIAVLPIDIACYIAYNVGKETKRHTGDRTMTNKPGTPPNTSLILTDAELAYINRNFDGSKSAAIHQALGAMMSAYAQNRHAVTETMDADLLFIAAARILAGGPDEPRRESAIGLMAELLTLPDDDEAGWCDWLANGTWTGAETLESVQAEIDELAA